MSFTTFYSRCAYMILIFLLIIPLNLASILFAFPINTKKSSDVFPNIEGWKKSENIKNYTPDNLYEYIDGAAELYLSYDFQELSVAEYINDSKASITVEIYQHKTPLYAFGIYSQERSSKGNFLNIGAQGYIEVPILNFVAENAYVKISSYNAGNETQNLLKIFAKKVAENLGGNPPLPAILDCFPGEGKKQNSEKFIARSFLGHGFLNSGFIADYFVDNKTFQLFIIEGADSNDCRNMLTQYFQLSQTPRSDLKEDRYTISDPYHEEIALAWKKKYIWGALNLDDENLRSNYLQQIEQLIEGQNGDKDQKNKDVQREKKVDVDGVAIEMVYIPAGAFLMGSPEGEESRQENESPQHKIVINKGFWMGKYEVTQGQWKVVMDGNEAYFQDGDNYPVEWVSWDLVQEWLH